MNKARSFLAFACTIVIVITCVSFPAKALSLEDPLSRGNAVQMLFDTFFNFLNDGETRFVDIIGKPYSEAVVWAEEFGLAQGDGNRRFNGDRPISRAETAVLIHRLVNKFLLDPGLKDIVLPPINNAGYDDYANVPTWAKEAMSFAVSGGFLRADNRLFRPFETMTKDEFREVIQCVQVYYLGLHGCLVNPDRIDYSGVIAESKQAGARLYLGMTKTELEEIFRRSFNNDWTYYIKGALITCRNDLVVSITASISEEGNLWDFNGVSKNNLRKDVVEHLGKPAVTTPKGSLRLGVIPPRDIDSYYFNAEGKVAVNSEDAVYFLNVEYNDDGSVYNIELSNTNSPKNKFSTLQQLVPTGFITFQESGKGNASIINPVGQTICLSITYTGTGEFSILGDGAVLFSQNGPYTGTILLNDMLGKKLDIRAKGDWSLTGMYALNSSKYMSVRSGSGDYVLPTVSLFGNYQVSHQGEGPFVVKWVPAASGRNMKEIVIADAQGNYTGTYDFGTTVFPGYVVIKADGDWTFGPIRQYTVVE
jgi:S-layer homology domain.